MATVLEDKSTDAPGPAESTPSGAWDTIQKVLRPLASLRLTVVLFLMGIFIVLAGTFAQVNDDIWKVIHDYFRIEFRNLSQSPTLSGKLREFFVWIELRLFFPPAFFLNKPPEISPEIGIWFPKGWVIGLVMILNLLAAHLVRFKVQATGKRLYIGWGVIAAGAIVTWLVIMGGSGEKGLQDQPVISYSTLWGLLQFLVFALSLLSLYLAYTAGGDRIAHRWLFGGLGLGLLAASILAFQLDVATDSTMRILYQLVQATFAGTVLLSGCIAVFRKRGGIVLMHAGILLIMAYEVLVGLQHVESQMHIPEGGTVNFSRDMRDVEFAIEEPGADNKVSVTVVDSRYLSKKGGILDDSRIPFKLEVIEYYPNSTILGPRQPLPEGMSQENPATVGVGEVIRAVPVAGSTGTDVNAKFDVPSAYVKVTDRSGKDLGTFLLTAFLDLNETETPQTVTVDGKSYDISLRFRRIYYPYEITLNDFQKNDYKGTTTVRDFSSYITLNDPENKTKFDYRIWMNNPMRYAGKTFYQASFSPDQKSTTLQVVDNVGWMTPYVACMMVVVGMIYHFGITLLRFLQRRLRETTSPGLITDPSEELIHSGTPDGRDRMNRISWIVTGLIVGSVALGVLWGARPVKTPKETMNLTGFGELPIWYKGRAQPLDTLARNSLMLLSDYQSFKLKPDDKKKQPAIRWLIDIMADEEKARDYPVIRIESEEVLQLLGLTPRPGFTYSINELKPKFAEFAKQAGDAAQIDVKDRTPLQKKIVETGNKILLYQILESTLGRAPEFPPDDSPDAKTVPGMARRVQNFLGYIKQGKESIEQFASMTSPPLVVPTHLGVDDERIKNIESLNTKWETLTIAHTLNQFYSEFPAPTPAAITGFINLIEAYKEGDVAKFNSELEAYQSLLQKYADPEDLPIEKVRFEAWYNRVALFNLCSFLYVIAFVLGVLGWMVWPKVFERASFWLIVLILIIQTGAVAARIYISGRPPVTNLYSSAVFISWGLVLGGIIVESMTRLGLGNVAASAAGFLALRIAHALSMEGDTFVVLQAVLDTQFWLATHVVCITLGYATTFLAGFLGILFVLQGVLTPRLNTQTAHTLARMTYGTVCFSLFFSFWGTVLGGLWADDSWGRFWGWDPKENGALIIVLWNALILHARWGGMVRERGLALLAIIGNVVTSWSWFGTNELGVGLHSYGFTEGRLKMLGIFVISQFLLVALGLIPRRFWWSSREPQKNIETAG